MAHRPNSLSMTTGALRHTPLTGQQLAAAYGQGGTSPTRRTAATRNTTDHVAALLGGGAYGAHGTSPTRRPTGTPMTRTGSMPPSTPQSRTAGLGFGLRAGSFGSASSAGLSQLLAQGTSDRYGASPQASAAAASTSTGSASASSNGASGTSGTGASQSQSSSQYSTNISFSSVALNSTGKTSTRPISLAVGAGCTQGFRPTMEDAHFDMLHARTVGADTVSIVGILDGHCGRRVADLGAHMVPDIFLSHPLLNSNIPQAIVDAVALADKAIFQQLHGDDGGSTLICAVICGRTIVCANLGDARAVLSEGAMAIPLSVDHKPTDPAEQQRVRRCGGTVQLGRIGGRLAVSRALGDFEFKIHGATFTQKEFQVSNVADIRQIPITDATRFMILACDGLWDVLSNEEAVTWVSQYLGRANIPAGASEAALKPALNACAAALAEYAVHKGSMDNVSVLIVTFHAWQGR